MINLPQKDDVVEIWDRRKRVRGPGGFYYLILEATLEPQPKNMAECLSRLGHDDWLTSDPLGSSIMVAASEVDWTDYLENETIATICCFAELNVKTESELGSRIRECKLMDQYYVFWDVEGGYPHIVIEESEFHLRKWREVRRPGWGPKVGKGTIRDMFIPKIGTEEIQRGH